MVGFPAGSGADVLVRYFADKLRPLAGRTVIVENKPGAASNIATEYVAKSKPDGHTIYPFAVTTVASSMSLFKKPPVDVGKSLRAVASTSNLAFMLVVGANSPYKTVAELTEAMKKKGSAANYAVSANPGRIMGAIYKDKAGLSATEVQYRAAPDSLNELENGRMDYGLHDPVFVLAQVRAGRLRALAVSTAKRLDAASEIPTMTESGIPMNLALWWGVMVPAATPDPIANKINQWFTEIVKQPETKKFLNEFWRRSHDPHARRGPEHVPGRDQGMGRLRAPGRDRAAIAPSAGDGENQPLGVIARPQAAHAGCRCLT